MTHPAAPVLPSLSDSDRVELAEVTRRLRANGRTTQGSVEAYLRDWTRFSNTVGNSRAMTYELAEYLHRRDLLEEAVGECSPALAERLRAHLDAADEYFLASTVDDGGRSLSTFVKRLGEAWWWRRRPTTGPLSAFLDEP
jgi:hypothetical protein